jgi:hypothetical protein
MSMNLFASSLPHREGEPDLLRILTLQRRKGVDYLLRDEFITNRAAGAVHGTAAEPGPGTRAVVDTNARISITGGKLTFASGEAANDGLWLDLVSREAGRLLAAQVSTTANTPGIGWDTNQSLNIRDRLQLGYSGALYVNVDGGANLSVGSYAGTDFYVALVMRAAGMYWFIKGGNFAKWTLLYLSSAGSTAMYPGIQSVGSTPNFSADFLRVPKRKWLPALLAYDSFTRADGALGSSETRGPDGQLATARVWSGSTWRTASGTAVNTPATLGENDVSNGDFESGDPPDGWTAVGSILSAANDERTGGSGTKSLSVVNAGAAMGYAEQVLDLPDGTWVRLDVWTKKVTGDFFFGLCEADNTKINTTGGTATSWQARHLYARLKGAGCKVRLWINSTNPGEEARFDDVQVRPVDFSELITVFDAGTASVLAGVDVLSETFGQAGLAACCDSATNPQNLVLAHLKGSDITLEKCVNGVWSRLIWTVLTFTAGATLRLITYREGGSLKLRLYYNGALIDSEKTITDASIINNTLHGMISTDGDLPNRLDHYNLYARGEEGQYESFLKEATH